MTSLKDAWWDAELRKRQAWDVYEEKRDGPSWRTMCEAHTLEGAAWDALVAAEAATEEATT